MYSHEKMLECNYRRDCAYHSFAMTLYALVVLPISYYTKCVSLLITCPLLTLTLRLRIAVTYENSKLIIH